MAQFSIYFIFLLFISQILSLSTSSAIDKIFKNMKKKEITLKHFNFLFIKDKWKADTITIQSILVQLVNYLICLILIIIFIIQLSLGYKTILISISGYSLLIYIGILTIALTCSVLLSLAQEDKIKKIINNKKYTLYTIKESVFFIN